MKNKKIIREFEKMKNNKFYLLFSVLINKNKKLTKLIVVFLVLIFVYILLTIYAKKIEMTSTFPWIAIHVQDLVWHVETDLIFEEVNIKNRDWELINGLYLWSWTWKTVYYFHGNGWPNSYFYSEIKYIHELGYNVMMYDYPWYWKSEWLPYKENVDESSKVFFEYLQNEKGIKNADLIVWWYSVWTAVATDFASKNDFERLILVSPLSSRYDMSRKLFWFALQKILFSKDSYVTKNLVKKFDKPVLIIHWNEDNIVSFEQWKKVFENYAWEKSFIEIDKFGHNWIIDIYWESLKYIFKSFLNWENLGFKNNYFFLTTDEKLRLEEENIEKDKIEKTKLLLSKLDFKTDSSIQKFVTSNLSFTNKAYVPDDLVNIRWDYIYDAKWWTQKLRKETKEALNLLAEAFYKEFNKKLSVVSAYRSYEYQVWIKAWWCPDNLCAKAWFSEHQSWLAVDLFAASSESEWTNSYLNNYYKWIYDNAHLYWFSNTYQRWLKVDWYEVEPWHWRFVWVEFATYLRENDLTIAEFYKNNSF